MPVQQWDEVRRLLGEVLSEGGLGGVGGTGTALDRRAEALARRVALGAGLVRSLHIPRPSL